MLQPSPCLEQGLTAPHLLQDRRDTSPPAGWKEHTATAQAQLAGVTGGPPQSRGHEASSCSSKTPQPATSQGVGRLERPWAQAPWHRQLWRHGDPPLCPAWQQTSGAAGEPGQGWRPGDHARSSPSAGLSSRLGAAPQAPGTAPAGDLEMWRGRLQQASREGRRAPVPFHLAGGQPASSQSSTRTKICF